MEIKKIAVSQINPAPYNPRIDLKPEDREYKKLKQSIETYGYVEPLVWNKKTKTLVSGHQRFKILLEQGFEEVDVSVVNLPLPKEKALNLALNKIRGDWNEEKLASLLEELSEMPDFNVELTGFDLPEISQLFDSQFEDKEDGFDFEEALKSIDKPITKKGDLIELGAHRILCGDSSNLDDLKKLFGKEKANLIHTDPPYNVSYYGGNRPHANGRPKKSKHWERIYADNLNQQDYEKWLQKIFTQLEPFLHSGTPFYIWNGHRQFGPMHLILTELKLHISCIITWAKPNFAIGFGDYNQQTEFCMYGWKHENGSHIWYGPTNETTLWQIKRDPTKEYIHPTQKPIALPSRAIRNSSKREDIVLDLFMGSGSTLIAAETLERRCFGIELSEAYCDAIVQRYIAFVGESNVSKGIKKRYFKGK